MTQSYSRLKHLDGLRGVAALVVVFSHLAAAFRPQMYFGIEGGSEQTAQTWFATSPFFILINGSSAVYIFFVLSGYVISASADRSGDFLLPIVLARWLRLSLPSAASIFLLAVIVDGGLSTSAVEAAQIVHHFWIERMAIGFDIVAPTKEVLKYALGWYYVTGLSNYNGVLWTMQRELIGSIGIYFVFFIIKSKLLRTFFGITIIFCLIYTNFEPHYYICFLAGSALYIFRAIISQVPSWVGGLGLAAGVLIGGKPFFVPPPGTFYFVFYKCAAKFGAEMYIWPLGAMLVVFGTLAWRPAVTLLGNVAGRVLGRLSFSVYLVHFPLLGFVMTWLFVNWGHFSEVRFVFSVVLYLVVVYMVGYVFTILVDEPSVRLASRVRDVARSGLGKKWIASWPWNKAKVASGASPEPSD